MRRIVGCNAAPAGGYCRAAARVAVRRAARNSIIGSASDPCASPRSRHVLSRALVHLLFTTTPRVRRPAPPTARVARALQLPLAPDRLRLLHGTVWIASTRQIPASRPRVGDAA
jgi:hypothetical protein